MLNKSDLREPAVIERIRNSLERNNQVKAGLWGVPDSYSIVSDLKIFTASQLGRVFLKVAYRGSWGTPERRVGGGNFESYALLNSQTGTIKWLNGETSDIDELENFALAISQPEWRPLR